MTVMILGFSGWYPYAELVEQCNLLGTVLLQCVSSLGFSMQEALKSYEKICSELKVRLFSSY